ncbi:mechanosensitive ion channel family protein [Methylobacterium komagatae]|uniref:Small-conductance mechanosensitive channel n=1 Tax=Methylobacterium komagatae TaxID=374425 RepID=A0ABW2BJU0_9HYPH
MATAGDAQAGSMQLVHNLQDIRFWEIGLIVAGTWAAIWLVRATFPYLAERGPSRLRLYLLAAVPIARLALMVFAVAWIVPLVFNVTLQNFVVIAGAASVAIGFAFKDYVSSLIAGVVALVERPYRPGDWVKVGSDYGEVRDVGLRAIVLQTPDDNAVTVPHSVIWSDRVTNSNDGAQTLQCVADFYLLPRHDAALVRSLLEDVALTSPYLSYAKPVRVVLHEEPWGTHYKLRAYPFDMRDQFAFVSDLTVRGKLAIADAGAVEAVAVTPANVT